VKPFSFVIFALFIFHLYTLNRCQRKELFLKITDGPKHHGMVGKGALGFLQSRYTEEKIDSPFFDYFVEVIIRRNEGHFSLTPRDLDKELSDLWCLLLEDNGYPFHKNPLLLPCSRVPHR